ncbi:MAG TPA: ABC transporter ATP-binding protein [Candidatus Polarisedimenticolia bacterium]|jgi:putative ABC transport system ATP-binding protein|nr:ABC transporter ATP-binding protein [Candidatus Polarisedimenticolia bacterium]
MSAPPAPRRPIEPESAPPIFEASGLRKAYRLGATTIEALRGVDLVVERGEFVVVAGPSGCGKTTLFNLLGALDGPDSGIVRFEGSDLGRMTPGEKTLFLRRKVGFVFQSFNLVPVLTAYENVEYPLWIDGLRGTERRRRTEDVLASVGLAARMRQRPDQLSGGERQRVTLARGRVHEPRVILADEPTANLDSKTGAEIVDLLARTNAERGTTFVIATHDPAIVERSPRTVRLRSP